MLYRKEGFPEEDELVLCTVTQIHFHSAFLKLDEYDRSGLVHISEIAPGRIRNLRDHITEGKKVVCKVLKIDMKKGHIDLSLRRVNQAQRRAKLNEIKQEQTAEKLIGMVAHILKKDIKSVYSEITKKVFNDYPYVYQFFRDVANDETDMKKYGISEDIIKVLEHEVKERFKPQKIHISGDIKLSTYDSWGVKLVRDTLSKAPEDFNIFYAGGGRFRVEVEDFEYKSAEKRLNSFIENARDFFEVKHKGTFIFTKR